MFKISSAPNAPKPVRPPEWPEHVFEALKEFSNLFQFENAFCKPNVDIQPPLWKVIAKYDLQLVAAEDESFFQRAFSLKVSESEIQNRKM